VTTDRILLIHFDEDISTRDGYRVFDISTIVDCRYLDTSMVVDCRYLDIF